jgi:membrane fusion protein, multidrug efflux system
VLPAADARRLARVAAYLAANRGARVEISGHADRRGGAAANAALAKARAESVRSALLVGGASEEQLLLRAPASVTGSGADDDARRVEVMLAGTP